MEPHYFGPFVHWFPKPIQKRLLRNFTLWGLLGRPTEDILDAVLAELRLLSFREFQQLFPGGPIWVERVLGMPKSYTAYALPSPGSSCFHAAPLAQSASLQPRTAPAGK